MIVDGARCAHCGKEIGAPWFDRPPWWIHFLTPDRPGRHLIFCSAACSDAVADAVESALQSATKSST